MKNNEVYIIANYEVQQNVGGSNSKGLSKCVRVIGSSTHRNSVTSEGVHPLSRIVGVSGKNIY